MIKIYCAFAVVMAVLPVTSGLAHASVSNIKFQESLLAFKNGDYKDAMLGFMDVVIEEPGNGLARNYLKESGRRVLETEDRHVQFRRKELLHGAEKMKRRLISLAESKEAKIREWDRLFSRVKSLAGSADSLPEAVSAYEEFVRKTPVYAELKDAFSEKVEIIKRTFYETIKNKYPAMVGGRTSVDEADLAGVFFAREALNDFSSRYVNSRQTENVLAKTSRIKHLRGAVSALFDDETRALELYSMGKFAEADTLFKKVLKARGANEEAAFYSELAGERAALALPSRAQESRSAKAQAPGPAQEIIQGYAGSGAGAALNRRPTVSGRSARRANTRAGAATRDYGHQTAPALSKKTGALDSEPAGAGEAPPANEGQVEEGVTAEEFYEQGVREFSIGNYKAAAKSWGECLRLNPEHTKAKLGIGRLKLSGG